MIKLITIISFEKATCIVMVSLVISNIQILDHDHSYKASIRKEMVDSFFKGLIISRRR